MSYHAVAQRFVRSMYTKLFRWTISIVLYRDNVSLSDVVVHGSAYCGVLIVSVALY